MLTENTHFAHLCAAMWYNYPFVVKILLCDVINSDQVLFPSCQEALKHIYFINMLTKDDLEQIGKLLDTRFKEEREYTKGLIHEEIQASEARLTAKIEKVQESVDIVQNVVAEQHMKLEKRVSRIEDHLGLSHHS